MTTVMQKKGSSSGNHLEMSSSFLWNSSTDGQTAIQWENDNMYVVVVLFTCGL